MRTSSSTASVPPIAELHCALGARVKAGDLIAQLSVHELSARLAPGARDSRQSSMNSTSSETLTISRMAVPVLYSMRGRWLPATGRLGKLAG